MSITEQDPTRSQFSAYGAAFDYFNDRLFDGKLPRCILNFSRRSKRTRGFFAPNRWERDAGKTHEISLNPDILRRPIADTMGTLVHEMVHLWQQEFGDPGRSSYHNKEWGNKMESVGLMPSDTGLPGGKRTGQRMTHYIIEDGPFDIAFREMPPEYLLPWTSGDTTATGGTPTTKLKVKYTCPVCAANVWGKPHLKIICGLCERVFLAEGTEPRGNGDGGTTGGRGRRGEPIVVEPAPTPRGVLEDIFGPLDDRYRPEVLEAPDDGPETVVAQIDPRLSGVIRRGFEDVSEVLGHLNRLMDETLVGPDGVEITKGERICLDVGLDPWFVNDCFKIFGLLFIGFDDEEDDEDA